MLLADFDFDLPQELIARHPPLRRRDSRLLRLDGASGAITHGRFTDLPAFMRAGDLLVLNNTRVLPAHLDGRKRTGGRVQILIARLCDAHSALALIKASRAPAPGESILLGADGEAELRVEGREQELFRLRFPPEAGVQAVLDRFGKAPLPPYLRREPEESDLQRYQTVYARAPGAVAAPTAGLHFDREMLAALQDQGVELGFLSLHVGLGTFAPLRQSEIRRRELHPEWCEVSEKLCEQLRETRRRGGRVAAVGTTVVRALEGAVDSAGVVTPFRGETRLFIQPGHRFRVVDALLSNFHLPRSSLLLLTAAFAGRENILAAYREAVARRYRFYSYGDLTLLTPQPEARGD